MTPAETLILQPAETEKIGDHTFSLWKVRKEVLSEGLRLSTSAQLITAGILIGMLAASRLIVDQTLRGNFLPMQVFGIAMMVGMCGLPILTLLVTRRRQTAKDIPVPPPGIPQGAVPAHASLIVGDGSRGGATGWLWVSKEWLMFRGDAFDFRLRPGDFKRHKRLAKALGKGEDALLQLPKGISATRLRLRFGFEHDGRFVCIPPDSSLLTELDRWATAFPSREPSLLPPLGIGSTRKRGAWWKSHVGMLPSSIFVGLVLATVPWLFRDVTGKAPSSWGMFAAGALVMQTCALSVGTSSLMASAYEREASKLRARAGQTPSPSANV